jgi:hypothetical protein
LIQGCFFREAGTPHFATSEKAFKLRFDETIRIFSEFFDKEKSLSALLLAT